MGREGLGRLSKSSGFNSVRNKFLVLPTETESTLNAISFKLLHQGKTELCISLFNKSYSAVCFVSNENLHENSAWDTSQLNPCAL